MCGDEYRVPAPATLCYGERTRGRLPPSRAWHSIGLVCLLALYGCQALPSPRPEAGRATALPVIGADGSAEQRSAGAIAADDARKHLLQHHLRFMARREGPPLIEDNAAQLLIDGPQTYDAMFAALAMARASIDIEIYIFEDDTTGRALADLLARKQREGVRVRLLYDSVGCMLTPRGLFDNLRANGIAVVEFNPVNPLEGNPLDVNNRDHRKLVIVDDEIAFTGGINISSVYARGSGFARRKHSEADRLREGWRDTQIEVRGPAVRAMAELFNTVWREQGGAEAPSDAIDTAKRGARGDKYVRVIGSVAGDEQNIIYAELLAAIEHAQRSVRITMSYFVPDHRMRIALENAARRGVSVQLVLPGFSDWWPVLEAGRSQYASLLTSGVEIYERKDAFLHAKTAVIDGVWSTVGSSNMDMRSFLHNSELNIVVLGNDFGEEMEALFKKDRESSQRIELAQWRKRPLLARLKENVARLFAYWL